MGGAHVTEAEGADGVYWNPANLGFVEHASITGMHFSPVPDLTDDVYFEYASWADQREDWGGGIGANIMFLTYGESQVTDASGIVRQNFSSWEVAVGVGYGTPLTERFAVGVGGKILHSSLSPETDELEEGKGTTWAVDVGIHGRRLGPMNLRWGLAIQNMGPALKFVDNGSPNPLPLNFRTGVGFDPYVNEVHRVTVALDMNKVLVRQRGGEDRHRLL